MQCAGYPEEKLRSLGDRLPCRETQVTTLLSLMGEVSSTTDICAFNKGNFVEKKFDRKGY